MGSVKNSSEIIEGVKRRAMIPDDNSTFNSDDFLAILNEEFMIGLLSTIMKVHEEFYVKPISIPLVNGTRDYAIPYRAIGNKLRNLTVNDSTGRIQQLTRIKPEDVSDFYYDSNAFYFRDNKIIMVDDKTGTLVMDIFLRPNQLVATSRGATISAIDTDTGIITCSATLPTHFTGTGTYDFVSHIGPCKIVDYDITATAINVNDKTLTFDTDDIPSDLVVGNYITFAEETIVPQMPIEMVPILEQRAAIYCLESIGDFDGLQLAQKKLERMEYNINSLIDNRSEGNSQKVLNRNSHLRQHKRKYFNR